MAEKSIKKHRSKEERIVEIDSKIQFYQDRIKNLEIKKEHILNPPPKKSRMGVNSIIRKAKESGMTPEEIAKKLGIEF